MRLATRISYEFIIKASLKINSDTIQRYALATYYHVNKNMILLYSLGFEVFLYLYSPPFFLIEYNFDHSDNIPLAGFFNIRQQQILNLS
jgi:hypothetical protein